MSLKSIIKNIWYPGSAYASEDWIEFCLRHTKENDSIQIFITIGRGILLKIFQD
jgi:hypothetical protein